MSMFQRTAVGGRFRGNALIFRESSCGQSASCPGLASQRAWDWPGGRGHRHSAGHQEAV